MLGSVESNLPATSRHMSTAVEELEASTGYKRLFPAADPNRAAAYQVWMDAAAQHWSAQHSSSRASSATTFTHDTNESSATETTLTPANGQEHGRTGTPTQTRGVVPRCGKKLKTRKPTITINQPRQRRHLRHT